MHSISPIYNYCIAANPGVAGTIHTASGFNTRQISQILTIVLDVVSFGIQWSSNISYSLPGFIFVFDNLVNAYNQNYFFGPKIMGATRLPMPSVFTILPSSEIALEPVI